MHDVSGPKEPHPVAHAMKPVVAEVVGDDEQRPHPPGIGHRLQIEEPQPIQREGDRDRDEAAQPVDQDADDRDRQVRGGVAQLVATEAKQSTRARFGDEQTQRDRDGGCKKGHDRTTAGGASDVRGTRQRGRRSRSRSAQENAGLRASDHHRVVGRHPSLRFSRSPPPTLRRQNATQAS